MKQYWLSLICLGMFYLPVSNLMAAGGVISGTKTYTIPEWFKDSFLEIQEDIKEAKANNKHVILFMHLDGCPYCSRMLDENFRQGQRQQFLQQNFDVIDINIRGDREIIWDEQTRYLEKTLARELNVRYTPTIVFLNQKGQRVLQLNGYRDPVTFQHVLNYVKDKHYMTVKLADYIKQQKQSDYRLREETFFSAMTDFSDFKQPLAIIFEDKRCSACDEFHQKVLNHKDVLQELKKFRVVRLDAGSDEPITDNHGKLTTPRAWADSLKLDQRPGTILFDSGEEITRADGHLYHFHYKELLRYVSGGFYFQHATFNQYLSVRQKQLTAAGIDIDFGL